MQHFSATGILVCYAFVSVQFNRVFKFPGTVKIRECEGFPGCKSRRGRYHFRCGGTLKLSGRKRSYEFVLRYGIQRSVTGNHWGERIKILNFGLITG